MANLATWFAGASANILHIATVTGNLLVNLGKDMVTIGGDMTNWGVELLKMISGV